MKKDWFKNRPGLKKAGILVFLFFLLKGLVWIGVFLLAWYKLK